jgi:hypothetical protein
VSNCAEQAKRAAKTFDTATDLNTHESVGHLLITFRVSKTLWKSSEITSQAFFRSLLGPTQPVTVLPVCFSDAFPVIVPSGVEIVTCQFPVTSAARTRADGASKSAASSKTRICIASPSSTERTRHRRSSLRRLQFLATMLCPL